MYHHPKKMSLLKSFTSVAFLVAITSQSVQASDADSALRFADCANVNSPEYAQLSSIPNLKEVLATAQDALFIDLKKKGLLVQSLEVSNDITGDIIYIDLLQNENGELLGLAYRMNKYPNNSWRSTPRIFPLEMITRGNGVSLSSFKGKKTSSIRGSNLTKDGGTIQFQYATDINSGAMGEKNFQLKRTANGKWELIDPSLRMSVKEMKLVTWFNLFSQNGGIKKLEIQ